MTNRNKRRVTVAVAAILGATVSASLYARYADQPIGPERDAPRGAMCLELEDSAANQELKAKYDLALEAQKQAEADLVAKQEAVEAQRNLLLQARQQQQHVAAECANAVSEQQQAERAANREAQRKAAELAQREALEAAQRRQAEWQAAVTAQQQAAQEAQQRAAEEARKWQAAVTAQQQAAQQAQQKAAEDAQKRQAEWQAAVTAQQQAAQEAQQRAAEETRKRQAEWQAPSQERNDAAMAQGQYGAPFDAAGYPAASFPPPFEAPGPLAQGDFPGMDWDYLPERPGFPAAGYADTRKEMFEAHQRRRDEMQHRRYAMNERLDTLRRDGPYRTARYYETSDHSLAEMCEAFSNKRD